MIWPIPGPGFLVSYVIRGTSCQREITLLNNWKCVLGWHVAPNFLVAFWRSKSQHDCAAKSCPAYNYFLKSHFQNILQKWSDHHIETPCRKQHLGRYLGSQGHSMTLQQKRVRPITNVSLPCPLFDSVPTIHHFTK